METTGKKMEKLHCTKCGNGRVEVYTNGLGQINFHCECGSVTNVDMVVAIYLDAESDNPEDGRMINKYTEY